MEEHENGAATPTVTTHPGDAYQATRQRQIDLSNLTEEEKRAYRTRLARLKDDREEAMHAACVHAGKLGFVYRAETNDYVKMVSGAVVPEPPERPAPPAYPAPPPDAPRRTPAESLEKGWRGLRTWVHWLLAVPVGAFIGYGLGKLAGLISAREPYWFWLSVLLGVAVIVGMKLVLGVFWRMVGRKKAVGALRGIDVPVACVFTVGLLGLEAWLGGQALVLYSRQAAMSATELLELSVAFPMAIAVSVGVVLYSAVKGYDDGQTKLTEADLDERQQRRDEARHRAEVERIERDHAAAVAEYEAERARIRAKEEADRAAYEAEKEEFDDHRRMPEFQALLGYIGRVSVLERLIEETERDATNLAISRGHERASLR